MNEHEQVVLMEALPELALEAGDVGVVVHVHRGGEAYEVEFLTLVGETAGIATLDASKVRAVRRSEVAHVRDRLAA